MAVHLAFGIWHGTRTAVSVASGAHTPLARRGHAALRGTLPRQAVIPGRLSIQAAWHHDAHAVGAFSNRDTVSGPVRLPPPPPTFGNHPSPPPSLPPSYLPLRRTACAILPRLHLHLVRFRVHPCVLCPLHLVLLDCVCRCRISTPTSGTPHGPSKVSSRAWSAS